ncbi:MAG: DUF1801 domain-containing protein, partial [Actinomycetota bacterium]|nr:DUF1801 domain-containing protein [Actinomycetota bacterium]
STAGSEDAHLDDRRALGEIAFMAAHLRGGRLARPEAWMAPGTLCEGRCTLEKTDKEPSDYIASLPRETRPDVDRLDAAISDVMSGHPKTMWEGRFWGGSDQQIIGYGDYSYERSDGRTVVWFIVGLAQQKQYISVYVNAADETGYLTERYADRLGKAKVGKSSISFTSLDDIHLDVLLDLIAQAEQQMSQPR